MGGKANKLEALTGVNKPIIGMVHALPTPGSPRALNCSIDALIEHGLAEAGRLKQGGVDALLIENAGDVPFRRPENIGFETVSAMSVLGRAGGR